MERRVEQRAQKPSVQYPVSCVLRHNGHEFVAEVVNYHYRGACLNVQHLPEYILEDVAKGNFKIDFLLGRLCLHSELAYRVCWTDLQHSKTIGIEFLNQQQRLAERAERFLVNATYAPQVTAADPLDGNRMLLLKAIDVSETGMLLQTSLSNKHLFPGMRLANAELNIPGTQAIRINMSIENARPSSTPGMFLIGVAVQSKANEYKSHIKQYLSTLAPVGTDADEHFEKLSRSGLLAKQVKGAITFRTITTAAEYDDVLKLRFMGYEKHKKIKDGTTWQQQGEGLDKEGTILAGYLNGQLVCSMEMRFGNGDVPLRTKLLIGDREVPGIDFKNVVEFNKLVIHPRVQGTDIVLGMIQRVHAIVINSGQMDVILLATDKLKSLYARVGTQEVGVRVPHPYLQGEYLNLLHVPRSLYHDGMRFNPHAWNMVYKVLHEQMQAYGLTSDRPETIVTRLVAKASAYLDQMQKRRRGKASEKVVTQVSPGGGIIDPKWTRQEFLATVMYPYVLEAIDMIGQEKVDQVLAEMGIPMSYFTKKSNWLSVGFHDEFLHKCGNYCDKKALSRRAGFRALQRDLMGMNYYVFKHFLNPGLAFQSFAKIMPRFNKTRTYESIPLAQDRVRVSLGLRDQRYLPTERSSCDNWQASFEAYLLVMTGKEGKVKKLSCCYDGDRTCSYDISWETSKYKAPRLIGIGASIAAMFGTGIWAGSHYGAVQALTTSLAVGSTILATALFASMRRLRSDIVSSHKEFVEYQQEASERYNELQIAKGLVDGMYREAKLLESTSREIQANTGLSEILQSTLDAACNSFKFDRAFAMLVNENKTKLETAAVSGVDGDVSDLWKFSVDVTAQRDSQMVLSSVYHTSNPIVINDIDAHLFQLNEASRSLVKRFASEGFAIVAIPARQGRWGVIVADKKSKDRILDRRDVVILERLGQQLGIVLDKRSDFEREQKLRSYYQKYVPSRALADESAMQTPQLGGQLKNISVMFVDIRGFTALSEGVPPNVTLEILNRFFAVLEPVITSHGGVIDKYLGDGALITWGTVANQEHEAAQCIDAATTLLHKIETLNEEFVKVGFPVLKVGIGINHGAAIVGNIGSDNRMEYTCIGPSVNLASRLESLCKTYECSIVVADSLVHGTAIFDKDKKWRVIEGVEVRGVPKPITIWTLQEEKSNVRNLRSIG